MTGTAYTYTAASGHIVQAQRRAGPDAEGRSDQHISERGVLEYLTNSEYPFELNQPQQRRRDGPLQILGPLSSRAPVPRPAAGLGEAEPQGPARRGPSAALHAALQHHLHGHGAVGDHRRQLLAPGLCPPHRHRLRRRRPGAHPGLRRPVGQRGQRLDERPAVRIPLGALALALAASSASGSAGSST